MSSRNYDLCYFRLQCYYMSYYLPYHETYMTIHQHNESSFDVTQLIVRLYFSV